MTLESFIETLESNTERDPSGCVLWRRYVNTKAGGYGYVRIGRRVRPVHRVVVELSLWIPEGFDVHHTCGVRRCVNPDHLELIPSSPHRKRTQFGTR